MVRKGEGSLNIVTSLLPIFIMIYVSSPPSSPFPLINFHAVINTNSLNCLEVEMRYGVIIIRDIEPRKHFRRWYLQKYFVTFVLVEKVVKNRETRGGG